MISYFYFDLTGEKLPDPDDITDNDKGKWKEYVYGTPFDYFTKKTQKRILDSYLIDRLFQFGIIVEGDSEETAIDIICQALRIDKNREGLCIIQEVKIIWLA